ncbi:MAG TPA: hypothetical protein VFP85_18850 [Vicinamibacterales bacterium]|nr:hypothetical protein [Vicinamibacterales bacterium]
MRRAASQLAVVLGFVLAASAFTWPLLLNLGTHFTGDPGGDTGVYVWNQWVFHAELTTGHNPLATEKILSLSSKVDLTQHNYTAFLNLLAFPLISWLGVVASFNVVLLAVCVLNAVAVYGLARRATTANRFEAWLAGLVFAWAPAMVARSTGHFSLVAAAALPAFLWCLINAEASRSARDAALLGLCMAWAALSDAYYGVYCLMIAILYVAATLLRVTRPATSSRPLWAWLLDVLIGCFGGLIVGLVVSRGGEFTLLGVPVHVRSLYNPVLILTLLVIARILLGWRPQVDFSALPGLNRSWVKVALIAALACAGPLSPVLYGIGQRIADGRFVSPPIFWRSSPGGVDLLSFVTPNPQHPIMKRLFGDPLEQATWFVEHTASLSLVAIAIIGFAVWRAGYRPAKRWPVITLGFGLLALGPFIAIGGVNTYVPGPWALLRYLPGFGLARTPTRFSIVVVLGVAVLLAGALAAIGERWPQRRRWIGAVAAALIVFELWPAPRRLYSAEISPIYDIIASDPREVRILSLPFGVRDGVSSAGNFGASSQFNQTRHGKALIGGYLSRISARRVEKMRKDYPTLDALIKLSEPAPLAPEVADTLHERGDRLVSQANLGYVVIDARFIADDRARMVIDAFKLREVATNQHLTLYVPETTVGGLR